VLEEMQRWVGAPCFERGRGDEEACGEGERERWRGDEEACGEGEREEVAAPGG
jgi:hypothetical protein